MLDSNSTSFDDSLVDLEVPDWSRGSLTGMRVTKRIMDLVLLLFVAPFLITVLILCAVAIVVESRGPVLFRQKRFGLNGKEFVVTKFRTMKIEDADPSGGKQTQMGDPRVTKVGRFLRRSCLDELPQVWDILRGEMSWVGPRPHPTGMRIDGVLMEDLYPDYHDRLRVLPGLTGLSQVNGNRGPVHDFDYGLARLEYDKEYIENWSLWRDLRIIGKTPVLPFSKGCY